MNISPNVKPKILQPIRMKLTDLTSMLARVGVHLHIPYKEFSHGLCWGYNFAYHYLSFTMAEIADDDSVHSDFGGFDQQDVDESFQNVQEIKRARADEDVSDIEISDFDSDNSESDDEPDTDGISSNNGGKSWSADLQHSVKFGFTGPHPGPTVNMEEEKIEFDFFSLFFPLVCFEIMVLETNRYARQKQEKNGPDKRWKEVIFFLY